MSYQQEPVKKSGSSSENFHVENLEKFFLGVWIVIKFYFRSAMHAPKVIGSQRSYLLGLYFFIAGGLAYYFTKTAILHLYVRGLWDFVMWQNTIAMIYNDLGFWPNFIGIWGFLYLTPLSFIGSFYILRLRKAQRKLDLLGLKNGQRQGPKVLDFYQSGPHQHELIIKDSGIGINGMLRQKDSLASAFDMQVLEIKSRASSPSIVEINFTTQVIPKYVDYTVTVGSEHLKEGEFVVGVGQNGVEKINIDLLPHLLIAGATGTGKSVCTKQVLTTLMAQMAPIQFYLVDMKGGVELGEFKDSPVVRMATDMEESIKLLRKVDELMKERFIQLRSLRKSKFSDADKVDRLIVCVDEASVLLGHRARGSKDYELALEARELIGSIARLGRAAKINLILATQRVSQDSIDTTIQENLTGRICFKANTPENSIRALGVSDAKDLPAIKGRAIFQRGDSTMEVQVPDISPLDIHLMLKKQRQVMEAKGILHEKMIDFNLARANSSRIKSLVEDDLRDNP